MRHVYLACVAAASAAALAACPQITRVAHAAVASAESPNHVAATGSATGSIDWRTRRLEAQASALPPANARLWADVSALGQVLAEERLYQALAQQVAELRLGCGAGTPAALLAERPAWAAHVAAAVRHATVIRTTYAADGRVSLAASLPFDGGPGRLGALWAAAWRRHTRLGGAATFQAPAPGDRAPDGEVEAGPRRATGLVVQTKGLALKPALWPRLVDTEGRELYGPRVLHADVFAASGVAPFHTSVDEALHDPRVSERATVVRATALAGPDRSDVVLATAEAARVRGLLPLLREGKVVFVVDEATK